MPTLWTSFKNWSVSLISFHRRKYWCGTCIVKLGFSCDIIQLVVPNYYVSDCLVLRISTPNWLQFLISYVLFLAPVSGLNYLTQLSLSADCSPAWFPSPFFEFIHPTPEWLLMWQMNIIWNRSEFCWPFVVQMRIWVFEILTSEYTLSGP